MQQFEELIVKLLNINSVYFSSMIGREKLGEIIKIASTANNYINIAEKFLDLIEKTHETK